MSKINIRKRGNYYEYRVEIAPIDGKRQWLSKSGYRTKPEAQEAGVQAYNEYLNAGIPFKTCDLSYSDYLDYWLENYCKNNLRYNTIQTYTLLIKKYIKPKIGKFKLSTITSVSLNSYITDIVNEFNHSKSYFNNILKVVKGSFRDACNLYGFIKYNPALSLRLPKINKYSEDVKHLYTKEEIDIILEKFKDNATFICSFLTSCYTGMRTGEVFALTWEDIDLDKGTINIKHSVYDKSKDNKGRWFLGQTKTYSGTRTIYIGNTLKEALTNYKKRQDYLKEVFGQQYKYYHLEDDIDTNNSVDKRIVINTNNENIINLVFTKEDGTYVGTDITKYPYKIIKNELNINARFYDLRGTYATRLTNSGTMMNEVSELMGHSDPSITRKYYISTTEDNKREAINNLDIVNNSDVINNVIKFEV